MRYNRQRSSRLQPVQRSFTSKQTKNISCIKILGTVLLLWVVIVVYWFFVIGLSHNPHDGEKPGPTKKIIDDAIQKAQNQKETLPDLANLPGLSQHVTDPNHRIWTPQKQLLRKLDFTQPGYVTEMIKSEFNNAQWKPKGWDKKFDVNYDQMPSKYREKMGISKKDAQDAQDANKDTNNNNAKNIAKNNANKGDTSNKNDKNNKKKSDDTYIKPSGNYKCLHYCTDVYNYDCVLKHIEYYKVSQESKSLEQLRSELNSQPLIVTDDKLDDARNYPTQSVGYITFKNDCGGFNNVRQAFEYFITSAWLYKRTLVFPVTEGWYLIDWGPIKRAIPKDTSGVSNYWLFYDTNDLNKVISLMNMTEFLEINGDFLNLDERYRIDRNDPNNNKICEKWNWDTRQAFKQYLNEMSVKDGFNIPFGPNHNVLMWPNDSYVMDSHQNTAKFLYNGESGDSNSNTNSAARKDKAVALRKDDSSFDKLNSFSQYYKSVKIEDYISHRQKREYTKDSYANKRVIHYPSCHNNDHSNHRYLSQTATTVAFGDYAEELRFKRMIRDHVHLVPEVFEIAGYVISYLGLFEYSAAHIRRNDFQFKNAWTDAKNSFDNIDDLLIKRKDYSDKNKHLSVNNIDSDKNGEILYIATDAELSFFDSVKKNFEHSFYRYDDFFNATHGRLYDDFNEYIGEKGRKLINNVPRKLVGLIEMVICAGGRRFFGTSSSTYSAYITRLRGYIDAPDKGVYFHNKVGLQQWHYRATEYMREFPDMWEDIKDYC